MLLKRNILEPTSGLTGPVVGFEDHGFKSEGEILTASVHKMQCTPIKFSLVTEILSGNRCGHLPEAPRFYDRPKNHKRRPSILETGIRVLESAYHLPKKFLEKFINLNSSNRRKRSERREAVCSVSQVLLHYLDLETLHAGFFDVVRNRFVGLDLNFIANKAGITVIRAKRAIADLVKAGYISLTRQFDKKDDGTFKGIPSIRQISVQFFIDLKMDIQRLFFSREWKRKKREKIRTKENRKKISGMLQSVTAFGGRRGAFKRFAKKLNSNTIENNKNLISLSLEMHKKNPERAVSDYYREIQIKLNE